MLRKVRLIVEIVIFTLITLLFLDVTGTFHQWFGFLAKIQFLPAVLALNLGVLIVLVLLTLVFGRVYCSVICPLGAFQDIVSRISGKRKKMKFRFTYSPAKKWLRYSILVIFIVAIVASIGSVVALLAPYSSYGRIAQNLFAPIYGWGNNLLALIAERVDSYAIYNKDVFIKSLPTFIIALVTFIALVVLAWRNGRTYCNTICPVGTVLGLISKFSLFKVTIDTEKCNACGLCARQCKSSCINSTQHKIDYTRCVVCMDCVDNCKQGAIHYKMRRRESTTNSASRRSFLTGAGVVVGTAVLKAQEKKVDGGLAVILDKKIPSRGTPIVPAGAQGLRHLRTHCTGCQLCVATCPNNVLRPSSKLETLMQPESSYEKGYCRPECTKCSQVCPAGAILPISAEEKSSIKVGHAVWVKENCIPLTDGVSCGNCARHCPSGAITMVPYNADQTNSPLIPVVNDERCIGCGACENLCPARPFSAIYIEGNQTHRTI